MGDGRRRTGEGSRHARERLNNVRDGLLRLHKGLLASERVGYEKANGRIASRQEFLQLALKDDWFAWLRPVSELIVQIDELLGGMSPSPTSVRRRSSSGRARCSRTARLLRAAVRRAVCSATRAFSSHTAASSDGSRPCTDTAGRLAVAVARLSRALHLSFSGLHDFQ